MIGPSEVHATSGANLGRPQFLLINFFSFFPLFKTPDMTSEGLGEMFEGDYADMCGGKSLLVSMGGPGRFLRFF